MGDAFLVQSGHHEARHGSGADDQGIGGAQGADVRGRCFEAGTEQGPRDVSEVGLRMGALADPQRLLQRLGEFGRQCLVRLRFRERRAQLTEDLSFADGHGVQPAGDPEQVLHGLMVVVRVEVPGDIGPLFVDRGHECIAEVGQSPVEGGDIGDEFETIARREHRESFDILSGQGVAAQSADLTGAEGHAIEHVDRSRLM